MSSARNQEHEENVSQILPNKIKEMHYVLIHDVDADYNEEILQAISIVFQKMFSKTMVARQIKEYKDGNNSTKKSVTHHLLGHWSFSSTPDMLRQETLNEITKYQSDHQEDEIIDIEYEKIKFIKFKTFPVLFTVSAFYDAVYSKIGLDKVANPYKVTCK